ncbi:glycoside hydrolase family 76 protein [Fodinicola acaciae]|uniref:glycoside hydrolase family 76 protein n=1 Tax=Fodinicola acaciae TaxID=2681555 RepID=UPI001C9E3FFF|nr:glycoside hydrolase family 76 protein [Fodinicola acaciae]
MWTTLAKPLLAAGLGLALTASVAAQPASASTGDADRAVASYSALTAYFGTDKGLFLESYPNPSTNNPYSYVWPYSQATIGALNLAGIPGLGRRFAGEADKRLANYAPYWNAGTTPPGYDSYVRPPLGQGGDKFYDDNEWIALSLIQNFKRTGDWRSLSRAEQIFQLVTFGWDTDTSHPCPGGVYWTQAPWSQDRNTVSNGPGAEVGLHLYLLTGKRSYLEWAKRMYDWTNGCLLAPNGLYWDHIDLAGKIEKTQWSYNQGVMLGASTLLYLATHDPAYLKNAQSIAAAALKFYGDFTGQPSEFNSIFFKNLLILDAVRHDPAYRAAMAAYAEKVWNTDRDPATGLFRFDGDKPVTLLQQGSMVQTYALLAWPRGSYLKLA